MALYDNRIGNSLPWFTFFVFQKKKEKKTYLLGQRENSPVFLAFGDV